MINKVRHATLSMNALNKVTILCGLLYGAASLAFATGANNLNQTVGNSVVDSANSNAFMQFDRQMSIGYGMYQSTLQNGAGNQTLQQSQFLNLELERLFAMGLWLDVNASMITSTNSLGNSASGTGQGNSGIPNLPGMPASQDPALGGVNIKVGYAFPLLGDRIQLTPYGLVGRNANLSMSTIISNGYANVTNDYFYTGGIGGRLEYRPANFVDLYIDQLASYNWDQSGPVGGIEPQNNVTLTTTVGAKFNLYKNFQLAANLFYNNFQYQSNVPPASTSINGGTGVTIYQPQYNYGGMISVGLTY